MAEPRTLPHDLSAERGVIGSLLIQNSGYAKIADLLQPRMMFRDAHRKILAACYELCERGEACDLITVKAALERKGELEDVGGFAYLSSLVDGIPGSWNIRYYAEIVRDKAVGVGLILFGQKVIDRGYAAQLPAQEQIREAELDLGALSLTTPTQDFQNVPSMLSALNGRIAQRVERRGQISGWPTGFPELDLYTHGWQPGHMVVVAGQTSFGKSVFALNSSASIAKAQGRVLYYSFEMRKEALVDRLLASESGVPLSAISWGNLGKGEFEKIAAAQERLHDLRNLEIKDHGSRNITDIERECRAVKADRGLACVVLDHFQLMDAHGEGRIQELAAISRRLQHLAVNLGLVVFVVSQLTLDPRDMKRDPELEDLRECKSLGHDAHDVVMLAPHKPAEARTETPVILMKLLIRKSREGRLGRVWLDFERDYLRFVQAEEPKPVPKAAKAEKEKPVAMKTPSTWG